VLLLSRLVEYAKGSIIKNGTATLGEGNLASFVQDVLAKKPGTIVAFIRKTVRDGTDGDGM
jgi:hypothetical protein